MFCKNCGTENPDNAAFCKSCGSPLERPEGSQPSSSAGPEMTGAAAPSPAGGPVRSAAPAANRNKLIGIIAVAVVAVVVVIVLLTTLLGGRGYKDTVNRFFDAIMESDARAIVDLIPEGMIDQAIESGAASNRNELVEMVGDELLSAGTSLLGYLGEGMNLSFKVVGDEDVPPDQLQQLQLRYDEYDTELKAAKDVTVELSYELFGFSDSQTMEIPVVQVGNSWYLDMVSLSLF